MGKGKSFTLRELEQLAASGFIRGYCEPLKAPSGTNPQPKGDRAKKGQKKSKYGAEKTEVDGITFDSAKEARRYTELKILLKAGEIAFLERQVPYELNQGGTHSLKYIADFRYYEVKKDQWVTEDCKGFRTKEYRKKRRLMKKLYDIEIKET